MFSLYHAVYLDASQECNRLAFQLASGQGANQPTIVTRSWYQFAQGMILSKKVAVIPSPLQVHQSYPVQLQFPQPGPAWLHPVLLWFPERGTGVIQLQWGQRTPGARFIAPVIQNRAKI